MKLAISALVLAMLGCGGTAKQRPPPAEETFALDSKADPSSDTASGGAPGSAPDMSGIVVGTRADRSGPLQGLSPGLTSGNITSYTPEAPKPFMGYSLIDRNFVSVENGKIVDVTNGIDGSKCPALEAKLTAAYGPMVKGMFHQWMAGPASITILGAKGSCSIIIKLVH